MVEIALAWTRPHKSVQLIILNTLVMVRKPLATFRLVLSSSILINLIILSTQGIATEEIIILKHVIGIMEIAMNGM